MKIEFIPFLSYTCVLNYHSGVQIEVLAEFIFFFGLYFYYKIQRQDHFKCKLKLASDADKCTKKKKRAFTEWL